MPPDSSFHCSSSCVNQQIWRFCSLSLGISMQKNQTMQWMCWEVTEPMLVPLGSEGALVTFGCFCCFCFYIGNRCVLNNSWEIQFLNSVFVIFFLTNKQNWNSFKSKTTVPSKPEQKLSIKNSRHWVAHWFQLKLWTMVQICNCSKPLKLTGLFALIFALFFH